MAKHSAGNFTGVFSGSKATAHTKSVSVSRWATILSLKTKGKESGGSCSQASILGTFELDL